MTKTQVVAALYKAEEALNEIQDNEAMMGALNLPDSAIIDVDRALKSIENILRAAEGDE